jgi:hypothetical protein
MGVDSQLRIKLVFMNRRVSEICSLINMSQSNAVPWSPTTPLPVYYRSSESSVSVLSIILLRGPFFTMMLMTS